MLMQVAPVTAAGSACVYSPTHQCSHLAVRIRPSPLASLTKVAVCADPRNTILRVSTALYASAARFRLDRYKLYDRVHAGSHKTDDTRSAVLVCSIASDRLYYGVWTLPPLRFLYFNIAQSLAVFYGKNRSDYYFTEGLPLLLTTALPFAVFGLRTSLQGSPTGPLGSSALPDEHAINRRILTRLSWTAIIMTVTLSMISHKEVRFLYPILPFLHLISAKAVSKTFHASLANKALLLNLLLINILLATYVSQIHNRGVIDVLAYLRHKHETRNNLSAPDMDTHHHVVSNTTVAFLMPCHSTPWRSHLVYPEIEAWALTCEPPIHVPLSERSAYLDEADEFYITSGPVAWLEGNMEDARTISASGSRSGQHWVAQDPTFKEGGKRSWPQNLVFFGQLEGTIKEFLVGSRYRECWRGFNTHFHDDGRRKGDVIVWCLDGM
jgi:phosphatidylinositol glycan class B